MHETSEERDERLSKKRKYTKKARDRKVEANAEMVHNKERADKTLSRTKQKNANPNYENPRFKEKIRMVYEDKYAQRRWKARKEVEMEKELFGEESYREQEKRYEQEKEINGEETWEERVTRYKKLYDEKKSTEQKLKENKFLERNKNDTYNLKNKSYNFI